MSAQRFGVALVGALNAGRWFIGEQCRKCRQSRHCQFMLLMLLLLLRIGRDLELAVLFDASEKVENVAIVRNVALKEFLRSQLQQWFCGNWACMRLLRCRWEGLPLANPQFTRRSLTISQSCTTSTKPPCAFVACSAFCAFCVYSAPFADFFSHRQVTPFILPKGLSYGNSTTKPTNNSFNISNMCNIFRFSDASHITAAAAAMTLSNHCHHWHSWQ